MIHRLTLITVIVSEETKLLPVLYELNFRDLITVLALHTQKGEVYLRKGKKNKKKTWL